MTADKQLDNYMQSCRNVVYINYIAINIYFFTHINSVYY